MALPCWGCLVLLYSMSYSSLHHNSILCIDLSYHAIDIMQFPVSDGKPPNTPESIEKASNLHIFVDSDNVGDQHTHRSLLVS